MRPFHPQKKKRISHQIAVMYLGRVVECGSPEAIFDSPQHPYTKALLSAIPIADPKVERTRERVILKGDLPSPMNPPSGCRFRTRCPVASAECARVDPALEEKHGRQVACIKA